MTKPFNRPSLTSTVWSVAEGEYVLIAFDRRNNRPDTSAGFTLNVFINNETDEVKIFKAQPKRILTSPGEGL